MADLELFFGGMIWGAAWLFVLQQTLRAIRAMWPVEQPPTAETFHEKWASRSVQVRSGALKGRIGIVQGTYRPRVEVAFPESVLREDRVWLLADDLIIKEPVSGT